MAPLRLSNSVRLIGVGMTALNGPKSTPSKLMQQALRMALDSVAVGQNQQPLNVKDITGLIAVPSLAQTHFMEAHYIATQVGLLPGKNVCVRTVDTGGAGPVTGLLEAKRMVQVEGADLVAVVAGDAVKGLSSAEFLKRADQTCAVGEDDQTPTEDETNPASTKPRTSFKAGTLPSPVIPNGYDRVAQYQMKKYGITREQLAACSALMSIMASRNPMALTKTPRTIQEVLSSPPVAPVTNLLECARRADGGAALLIASPRFLEKRGIARDAGVVVVGGGEASGPLYPPATPDDITEEMFSCEEAAEVAYSEAHCSVRDIDFFGLYDCFPICLIRAVEAVGLCGKGQGGAYIHAKYQEIVWRMKEEGDAFRPQDVFPVNTHGGLSGQGAPWEVPAMYNIIEAFKQLQGTADKRQIKKARRALVYGNGGIFSHSAVAILGDGKY
ncbi:hypothetical protein HDU76_006916 [Blyttiomyces sp. JEL0837]|nr:hypothetical protein HDU76_006916 [Blyttiomyces sp. JEL0837]